MNESLWEMYDGLCKTIFRQGRRVEELEARLVELERRLSDRDNVVQFPVDEKRELVEV